MILKFFLYHKAIEVIYGSSSSKVKLADVRPIVGQNRIYFVERDVDEQVDHLCKVLFRQDYFYVQQAERIYKVAENEIKVIQLCNEKLLHEDQDSDFVTFDEGIQSRYQ